MENKSFCEANLTKLNLNCSISNLTDAVDGEESSQKLLLLIPLILLIIITCIGNLIVMICTRIDEKLRTVSSLYVFSLAVADLIVGISVMAPMTVYTVNGMWPLGKDFCTTWMVFDFCCCTISMLHLCLVAHDRYVALVHPLEYKSNRTVKDALKRIFAAWAIGALAWIPCIVYIRYDIDKENIDPFDCFFTYNKWFVLIQSVVVYYFPIVIMCFFYTACLHKLRIRYRKTAALGLAAGNVELLGETSVSKIGYAVSSMTQTESLGTLNISELKDNSSLLSSNLGGAKEPVTLDEMKVRKRLSRQQQQLRSIRTLGLVILVFLFCWIPFCVFWPISSFCPDCISIPAYEYSYWAAYLNSSVNPALYFLANRDFRNAFRKLLRF